MPWDSDQCRDEPPHPTGHQSLGCIRQVGSILLVGLFTEDIPRLTRW